MRPILCALLAVSLYSALNTIIERKLTGVFPVVSTLFLHGAAVPVAFVLVLAWRSMDPTVALPSARAIGFLSICGLIVVCADTLLFLGYRSGGSLATMTTILGTLFPVVASVMKASTGGGLPTIREAVAWIFGAAAVVILCSGSPQQA